MNADAETFLTKFHRIGLEHFSRRTFPRRASLTLTLTRREREQPLSGFRNSKVLRAVEILNFAKGLGTILPPPGRGPGSGETPLIFNIGHDFS
jgi:hypothetical protein